MRPIFWRSVKAQLEDTIRVAIRDIEDGNTTRISSSGWMAVIKQHPEYAEHPEVDMWGQHWAEVLDQCPHLLDKLSREAVARWDGLDWREILSRYPEVAERYHPPWDLFTPMYWAQLLERQLQFLPQCPDEVLGKCTEQEIQRMHQIHPQEPRFTRLLLLRAL